MNPSVLPKSEISHDVGHVGYRPLAAFPNSTFQPLLQWRVSRVISQEQSIDSHVVVGQQLTREFLRIVGQFAGTEEQQVNRRVGIRPRGRLHCTGLSRVERCVGRAEARGFVEKYIFATPEFWIV